MPTPQNHHFAAGLIALIIIAGCAPPPPPAEVTLRVEAPAVVTARAAILPVMLHLQNHTAAAIQLQVGTPCAILRWRIMDAAGDIIHRPPNRLCSQVVATDSLSGGEKITRRSAIAINPKLFRANEIYQLHLQFWGYTAVHEFRFAAAN